MKKLISLLFFFLLLFAFALPAFAEGEGESHEHNYQQIAITQPTCVNDGTRTLKCDCGDEKEETISATGHQWNDGQVTQAATCTADGTKAFACSKCEATKTETISATGHQWNDGQVTQAATCTADGTKGFTCLACDATKTETISATGHSLGSASKVDDANHKRVCGVCNQEVVSGHQWNDGEVILEAGCTTEGKKKQTCTPCGATKDVSIPAKGHTFTKGEAQHTCSVSGCGFSEAHAWGNGQVTVKATCQKTGVKTFTCSVCGQTRTEEIKKAAHTYDNVCDPDCNVCGAKRTVSHDWTTTWSNNHTGHWHECIKCEEQTDYAKHQPGPEATEEREQLCLVCNYVIAPKKKHVHTYEKQWSNDKLGHWYSCTGCKDEKDYAAHKYQDACDPDCDICGYVRTDCHTYDDQWQTNKLNHWRECTVCAQKSNPEKHTPGPEATEKEAQICTVCKMELVPKKEHIHDFGTQWVQMEESHYQVCSCGEQSVPEPHSWDAGKSNKNGGTIYTCTKCGMEKLTQKASSGSFWFMAVLVFLGLVCIGGIAALVIILKRGTFDIEDGDEIAEPDEGDPNDSFMDE